jgi:hypothetical protein
MAPNTTIYSLTRSVHAGGTCRELRRSVGRSVALIGLLGRRPMLGCTDHAKQRCGCTLLDWASLSRLILTPM